MRQSQLQQKKQQQKNKTKQFYFSLFIYLFFFSGDKVLTFQVNWGIWNVFTYFSEKRIVINKKIQNVVYYKFLLSALRVVYIEDRVSLRGHHLLHQQKYLATYATDQNSDRRTRADASSQSIEDLCNL